MQLVLKFLVSPDNNGKMPKPSKNNHELSDLFVIQYTKIVWRTKLRKLGKKPIIKSAILRSLMELFYIEQIFIIKQKMMQVG